MGTKPELHRNGEIEETGFVGEEFRVPIVHAEFLEEFRTHYAGGYGDSGGVFVGEGRCGVGRGFAVGVIRVPAGFSGGLGRVESVGDVVELPEDSADAVVETGDVSGEDGFDGGALGGGVGDESVFETLAQGVVQDELARAMDQEVAFGDGASGDDLAQGLDEFGGVLALVGGHPVFALGEVVEAHGGKSRG